MSRIRANIGFSLLEKGIMMGGQFIVLAIYVRYLPLSAFGMLGVASSTFSMINLANIGFEPAIIRSRADKASSLLALRDTVQLTLGKCLLLGVPASILACHFRATAETDKGWALLAISAITFGDILAAPFVTYANSAFQQSVATRASLLRAISNIILCALVWRSPTLETVFIKDLLVTSIYLVSWLVLVSTRFPEVELRSLAQPTPGLLDRGRRYLKELALWTHLNGVATGMISRLDIFILSYFASPADIGRYNIALSVGGIVNTLQMILFSQNWIALSHCSSAEEHHRLSFRFLRLSVWISLACLIGFPLGGFLVLRATTGGIPSFELMFWSFLVASGIIFGKAIASPLLAHALSRQEGRSLVLQVSIPLVLVAAALYWIGSFLAGPLGSALGNLLVGCAWAGLSLRFGNRLGFFFPRRKDFIEDVSALTRRIRRIRST